ncbi:MAG TPA: hypothetical protein VH650_01045 [Gaiellaceae bacterium]
MVARVRFLPQGEHGAGRAGEGVAPEVHRRRPRVVRLADEARAEPEHARDRGHDPQVRPTPLEDGPLLDVELEVGADVVHAARVRKPRQVEPGRRHGVADAARDEILEVAVAAERPASQHPRLEPGSLLVVERDDPDGPARLHAVRLQPAHDVQRGEDAQRAVVAAA